MLTSESDEDLSEHELIARKPELRRQNALLRLEDAPESDSQKFGDSENSIESSAIQTLSAMNLQSSPVIDLTQEADDSQAVVADPDIHLPLPAAVRDRFRLQAKFFFLTWPQCDTPKEVVLARIKQLANYDYALVCRENHHDATGVHLHAFIAFDRQKNKTGCSWLDALADKHGNYQAARNNLKVVKYILKDGDYVFDGFDPVAFLAAAMDKRSTAGATGKGPTKAFLIADKIKTGSTIDDLDDFDPGYMLMNKRKIEDYLAWQVVKKQRLLKLEWQGVNIENLAPTSATYKIGRWLNANIKTERTFKQKQLYVWSASPNVGKTHLINELQKYLSVYYVPRTQYMDGYESGRYDLCVIDEFDSSHTIYFLNQFLQGSTMHLNQKGGGTLKHDNPPFIILANRPLEEVYRKACFTDPFKALLERFKIIKVTDEKIDVFHTLPKA